MIVLAFLALLALWPSPRRRLPVSGERFEPGSPEQLDLFASAAEDAGVPLEWASSPGLLEILRRESQGWVGVPNYTYGNRAFDPSHWPEVAGEYRERWPEVWRELQAGRKTARSSATGLGQLLLANVDRYYPGGRRGIGDAHAEAVGMLRYIRDRYGDPDTAWRLYGTAHEGY